MNRHRPDPSSSPCPKIPSTIEPGGISGILPDGSPAFVFADVPDDLMPTTSARRAFVHAPLPERVRFFGSAPNQHEYAFLYNDQDGAFNPKFDTLWAGAFANGPLTGPSPLGANTQYGVTTASINLDNIVALGGGGHPIDFLNISTHGMVGSKSASADAPLQYFMLSTTTLSTAVKTTYASDFAAGNLAYGIFLSTRETQEANTHMGYLVFTPGFLTSHLHFNAGAVVNFGSCYAQSPDISDAVATTLRASAATTGGRKPSASQTSISHTRFSSIVCWESSTLRTIRVSQVTPRSARRHSVPFRSTISITS